MIAFITHILMMASLGMLVYLIAQTLPKIDDTAEDGIRLKEHWILGYLEKADQKIKSVSEKVLRKAGVVLMRWENKVNQKVSKLKKETTNGGSLRELDASEKTKEEENS
ncbi:hypothetical protein A3A21_01770 [Candidatus Jorgensenbacteria bacterium RIFCSPLOWO2_01_FULL_45_25b]|uniref:Uncharacterized protein n=1 Tax=Candidatus Jorgensenbacteria bacterium RIFCSPLOWO2_01_FULL_45_25b TaxID=1798471 RepID=A0A1F6BT59_9BACT|nr:MAG: hypothetical protein A3A21_01770 [Candidatus Jorgensenbacteria bacterium RIFCSPLOWO2_01_FULL_45_25b]